MTKPDQFFTSLQALRGFAVLAVCIAHLPGAEAKLDGTPILGAWTGIGFAGVDLFFVISGFVMVWVTRPSQGSISAIPRFYLGRILRIYPLWWLVLSAVVAVWLIRPDWVYASHHVENDLVSSYLLLPAQGLPLHAVGWTLIHEVWFYLIFGILLGVPQKALPFLLLAWGTVVVGAALLFPSPDSPTLALIRHPLTLEFILGAFVGLLAVKSYFPRPDLFLRVGIFGLVIACASIVSNPAATFEAEWSRVLLFGCPFALILWGWVGLETRDNAIAPNWARAVGDWSYGLYLVHVLVFVAMARLLAPFSSSGPIDNIVLIFVSLATAIVAAFVLHIAIERPVARFGKLLTKRMHQQA